MFLYLKNRCLEEGDQAEWKWNQKSQLSECERPNQMCYLECNENASKGHEVRVKVKMYKLVSSLKYWISAGRNYPKRQTVFLYQDV